MKVEPLSNRVVIHRLEDGTSKGGILIPDALINAQTFTGEVIAVGPGKRDEQGVLWPCTLKLGDVVIFWKGAGTNVGMEFEKLTIVTEDDVLGKVMDDGSEG